MKVEFEEMLKPRFTAEERRAIYEGVVALENYRDDRFMVGDTDASAVARVNAKRLRVMLDEPIA